MPASIDNQVYFQSHNEANFQRNNKLSTTILEHLSIIRTYLPIVIYLPVYIFNYTRTRTLCISLLLTYCSSVPTETI